MPVHPGMLVYANRYESEGSSYIRVADAAAAAASSLQRDEAFLRGVKTAQQAAQRRAESAKRKAEKDECDKMEVEPPAQNDPARQAKMEQEMQAKFDKQFEEMKAMLQG
eukprot:9466410-Pyramimonas_sp.AAC.1